MSGHSKWTQIKHKKADADAKRGKLFSRLARQISMAARQKGPNPDTNHALRTAIEKARAENMPKSNIDRAIQKGGGADASSQLDEYTYEAYGPGGVAVIITCITDSNNRTSNEIKKLLSDTNSKWAEPGSVAWAFDKKDGSWESKPYAEIELGREDLESLKKLLEALDEHDDVQEIYTNAKKA